MIKPSTANVKEDYERYVNKATILIHAPETTNATLLKLKGVNPVQEVASATVMIMQRLDNAARGEGIEVQDTVKVFGAHEIVNLVIELGEAARKIPKMGERLSELTLSVSVQDYVESEVKAGRIDPNKLKVAMAADIRQLPPKQRKEIQKAQIRIQQTARQYNNGKGLQKVAPVDKIK